LGLFYDVMDEKNSSPFLIDSTQNSFNNISCKNDGKDYIVAYNDENNIKINREYKENGKLYTFSESYFWYYDHKFEIMEFLNKKALLTLRNGLKVNVLFINDNVNQTESVVLHNYDYIYNTAEKYNASYSTSLYNRNLLFVYESNINGGTSSDIWAKVAHIENLNFDKELFLKPTNSDYLFTNYPNPFNFSTTIIYQIVAASNIKISIFDILGREIKVLVNEPKNKGTYKVEFNSGGLASGIYFYKLEAFDTKVNKMILLK
ncbi:MAG: T9SS type A sorting domain-containing protein, partial [Melioribacteraceae bacterium]|nr:T9SS type A sorting domain-containing protein [Melioribacteraceae bacterium]